MGQARIRAVVLRFLATTVLHRVQELLRERIRRRRASGGGSNGSSQSNAGDPVEALPAETIGVLSHPERLPWADLVKRVWLAEILCCPCGGRRVVLAMVFDPVAIERILRHLGLPFSRPERAPPRARAGELPFSSE